MHQRQRALALLFLGTAALLQACAQARPFHRSLLSRSPPPPPHSDHWAAAITVKGYLTKQGRFIRTDDTTNLCVGTTYVIQVNTYTEKADQVPVQDHPIDLTFSDPNLKHDGRGEDSYVILTQDSPKNPRVQTYKTDGERSYKQFRVTFTALLPHGAVAQARRIYTDTTDPNYQPLFKSYRVFPARQPAKMRRFRYR